MRVRRALTHFKNMFPWVVEGRYRYTKYMVITPFLFSTYFNSFNAVLFLSQLYTCISKNTKMYDSGIVSYNEYFLFLLQEPKKTCGRFLQSKNLRCIALCEGKYLMNICNLYVLIPKGKSTCIAHSNWAYNSLYVLMNIVLLQCSFQGTVTMNLCFHYRLPIPTWISPCIEKRLSCEIILKPYTLQYAESHTHSGTSTPIWS